MFCTRGSWSTSPSVSEATGHGTEGLRSCKVRTVCPWAPDVGPTNHHSCLQLRPN